MGEKRVVHLTGSPLQRIIDRFGRGAVRIGVRGRPDLVEVDSDLVEAVATESDSQEVKIPGEVFEGEQDVREEETSGELEPAEEDESK